MRLLSATQQSLLITGRCAIYNIRSDALASRVATRRQNEMEAIESELKCIQRLVNKYDYKTPAIIVQRVQSKALKQRKAQKYFTIEVVEHPDRSQAPWNCATGSTTNRCKRTPNWMESICWRLVAKLPACRMPRS